MRLFSLTAMLTGFVAQLQAQFPEGPGKQASSNLTIVSHLMLPGPAFSTSDIELEQELSRPYAYVDKRMTPTGYDIISLKDPTKPQVIYSWRIENGELHHGSGSLAPTYIKSKGRYFFFNGFEFSPAGPDGDLAAIVWDVTGLPDTSKIKEIARIHLSEAPGGFHETFSYKHSNGQALVFGAPQAVDAYVYDVDRLVAGAPDHGLIARIPAPETDLKRGWHDFYAGYDPATHQDRFFGAGGRGYYVFDISNIQAAKLIATVTGAAGVPRGHTFTPTPDGRYAFTISEPTYQYAPMRVFDLKPAYDGQVQTVWRPIGAWTPNWQGAVHYFEVRWPYVFIAGQDDALQVINVMDPTNPYTVGYYDTKGGPQLGGNLRPGGGIGPQYDGVWGIDVRNADGLVVVSDYQTGFWAFKMDGFNGWNGHQWGMPNQSSAQDWDNGPDGAPKPTKVS